MRMEQKRGEKVASGGDDDTNGEARRKGGREGERERSGWHSE